MAECLSPKRHVVNGKRLPKVFIAYPHKPTLYTELSPPENVSEDSEVWRRYDDEMMRLEHLAEVEIKEHKTLVQKFADFLQSQSIAVAYDGLLRDPGSGNIMRWFQKQIEDSDYLILVITPSLCDFLDQKGPPDRERMFKSDYLYNVIHSRPTNREGKPLEIIPLFLSSPLNLDFVPMTLRGSTIYEVWDTEYKVPLSEDMTALLCRLTGQNRYQPPPPQQQIIIAPRKPKFGPKSSAGSAELHHTAPPSLSQNRRPLDMKELSKLAEIDSFSQHWKKIGKHLGLSEADIERCEGWGGGDVSEACLQMLKMCVQRTGAQLTVSSLSDAITRSGYHHLYSTLQSVL